MTMLTIDPKHPGRDAASKAGDSLLAECTTPLERVLVWRALSRGYLEGIMLATDDDLVDQLPMDDDGMVEYTSPFWVLVDPDQLHGDPLPTLPEGVQP